MLIDMTRVTVLRPALLSRDPPCPMSNQSLPSYEPDPEIPAPSVLALAHTISPAPHRSPSVAPPDTHRRLKLNLRCVSGGATERIGRGWGGLVSQKTCLLASTELIRPRFAGGKVRLCLPPEVTTPHSTLRPYGRARLCSLCKRHYPDGVGSPLCSLPKTGRDQEIAARFPPSNCPTSQDRHRVPPSSCVRTRRLLWQSPHTNASLLGFLCVILRQSAQMKFDSFPPCSFTISSISSRFGVRPRTRPAISRICSSSQGWWK